MLLGEVAKNLWGPKRNWLDLYKVVVFSSKKQKGTAFPIFSGIGLQRQRKITKRFFHSSRREPDTFLTQVWNFITMKGWWSIWLDGAVRMSVLPTPRPEEQLATTPVGVCRRTDTLTSWNIREEWEEKFEEFCMFITGKLQGFRHGVLPHELDGKLCRYDNVQGHSAGAAEENIETCKPGSHIEILTRPSRAVPVALTSTVGGVGASYYA